MEYTNQTGGRTGRPKGPQITVNCEACGKETTRTPSQIARSRTKRFFCCRECQALVGSKPRRGKYLMCERCGVEIYARPGDDKRRFCSNECLNEDQRHRQVEKSCAHCGKPFTVSPSSADRKTCSRKCDTEIRTTNGVGRTHNGRPVIRWSTGYLFVYEPEHPSAYRNGWLAEHRHVMEQQLGRRLTSDEHVHHVNGDKEDNDISNLRVMDAQAHRLLTASELREKRLSEVAELAEYRRRFGPLPE